MQCHLVSGYSHCISRFADMAAEGARGPEAHRRSPAYQFHSPSDIFVELISATGRIKFISCTWVILIHHSSRRRFLRIVRATSWGRLASSPIILTIIGSMRKFIDIGYLMYSMSAVEMSIIYGLLLVSPSRFAHAHQLPTRAFQFIVAHFTSLNTGNARRYRLSVLYWFIPAFI